MKNNCSLFLYHFLFPLDYWFPHRNTGKSVAAHRTIYNLYGYTPTTKEQ